MLNSILFYLVSFQKIKDEHLISSYNLINIINSIEKFIPGFMLSQKTISYDNNKNNLFVWNINIIKLYFNREKINNKKY